MKSLKTDSQTDCPLLTDEQQKLVARMYLLKHEGKSQQLYERFDLIREFLTDLLASMGNNHLSDWACRHLHPCLTLVKKLTKVYRNKRKHRNIC